MARSVGRRAPASSTSVGSQSIMSAMPRASVPEGIRAGQRAIAGTRWPPSNVLVLPPRRPPALPPQSRIASQGPLSLVKIDERVAVEPELRRASASSSPIDASSSSTTSPYVPRLDRPANVADG